MDPSAENMSPHILLEFICKEINRTLATNFPFESTHDALCFLCDACSSITETKFVADDQFCARIFIIPENV